jgi:hypothetical protein
LPTPACCALLVLFFFFPSLTLFCYVQLLFINARLLCFVGVLWDSKLVFSPYIFFFQMCRSKSSSFFHSTYSDIFQ